MARTKMIARIVQDQTHQAARQERGQEQSQQQQLHHLHNELELKILKEEFVIELLK